MACLNFHIFIGLINFEQMSVEFIWNRPQNVTVTSVWIGQFFPISIPAINAAE